MSDIQVEKLDSLNDSLEESLDFKLDAAIRRGISQGQNQRVRRHRQIRRRIGSSAAICVLLGACLLTIRVSPVFAAMLSDIPGMAPFVDMISHSYDRSLSLAADNDYIQPVDVSDEHDGLKLSVNGILADESRLVIFYEAYGADPSEELRVGFADVHDVNGLDLVGVIGSSPPHSSDIRGKNTGHYIGKVDIQMQEGIALPSEVTLSLRMAKDSQAGRNSAGNLQAPGNARPALDTDPLYKVRVPIDHSRFAGLKQEYAINEAISVEGQQVTFDTAELSPLHIALHVNYPESNSKQIFSFGDLRIVDEQGIEWKQTGASLALNHPVYYFESNYFHKPKSLFVQGSWLRALDKDQMKMVIDTDKEKIIQAPSVGPAIVTLTSVNKGPDYSTVTFQIKNTRVDDHQVSSLLGWEGFKDSQGRSHSFSDKSLGTRASWSSDVFKLYFYLKNEDYAQPLTFDLVDYPAYIEEPFRVQIK